MSEVTQKPPPSSMTTSADKELNDLRVEEREFFSAPPYRQARLESRVSKAMLEYLFKQGYEFIAPPGIVRASGACENVDTLFEVSVEGDVRWFRTGMNKTSKKAYLRQTGQLFLEQFVKRLDKICCYGSSFRAEGDIDDRHHVDFPLLEIEFAGNFEQLLKEIEAILAAARVSVLSDPDPETNLGISQEAIKQLEKTPVRFERISYDEAVKLLNKLGVPFKWGDDIKKIHEQKILDHLGGETPFFLTYWPDPHWNHGDDIEVEKFFNMTPDPRRPGRVQSVDTIVPFGGESIGGAARIWDSETLKQRLLNSPMYRNLQKRGGEGMRDFAFYFGWMEHEGSVPHAGCGIGLQRVLQWLAQEPDIRRIATFSVNRERLY